MLKIKTFKIYSMSTSMSIFSMFNVDLQTLTVDDNYETIIISRNQGTSFRSVSLNPNYSATRIFDKKIPRPAIEKLEK